MFDLKKSKIISLAILACIIWSTAFAVIKIGLPYCTPMLFAGIRFILAGLLLMPFCGGLKTYFKSTHSALKTITKVSLFQTFLLYSLFFWGMSLVSGSTGAIVTGSSPLITAVAAHIILKDDKLSLRKAIYIFAGILGVILISIDRRFIKGTSIKELAGIIILLGSTTASAFGNIVVSADKSDIDPITLNSAQMGFGGVILLLLSFLVEGSPQITITKQFIFALLWLAFISAAGFSIWFYLIKNERVKVSELNMWKFIMPILGALISWTLLKNDSPTVLSVIGMLIVAFSVLFFHLRKRSS
ncbi:DMT family transporter [candidate division WOR-3 bacterium]|nr:DMT family transporter [candidate division WOR-3 bacterium]